MNTRRWNISITYEPKIEPVRVGTCTQTIRALLPHKCKCGGKPLGLWKHGESEHHSSGSEKICPKCRGKGIIQPTPKKEGDLISFHGWAGVPYRSPWSWRTEYVQIKAVANVHIFPWGIMFPHGYDLLPFNYSGFHYSKEQLKEEFDLMWGCIEIEALAKADGIVPPTGEALRDVLISKNGPIPDEGIPAQIIRWSP